jgi:hypothetical protein
MHPFLIFTLSVSDSWRWIAAGFIGWFSPVSLVFTGLRTVSDSSPRCNRSGTGERVCEGFESSAVTTSHIQVVSDEVIGVAEKWNRR